MFELWEKGILFAGVSIPLTQPPKLMKGCLFLFLTLTCVVPLFSQEKIATYPIGWRGKHIEIQTIADKDRKEHCLFVVGADSIKGLLLDDEARVKRTFTMSRYQHEKLLGGFIRDGRAY